MLVVTAGHIDHGKTSLIRALTGEDTDRLPEEKARGISIDLGFAYWRPDAGELIGFVDVPGHDLYVRNMLAGVGGVDGALLVVAADDGIMPQTAEHLAILDLLGVARAIVAITKSDRADPERIARLREAIADLLKGTGLAGSPCFAVSSRDGVGLAALGGALKAWRRGVDRGTATREFRMAIDRAFSVTGAGTVVTGTVLAGELAPGAILMLAPHALEARVRGLQSAGRAVPRIVAGERCAVNLAGIEVGQVRRGDWLVPPAMHAPTQRLDLWLDHAATRDAPLRHLQPVHFHLGTADIPARLAIPRQGRIAPGSGAFVQLTLERPTLARTGDRFVLRDPSGRQLLGGGQVVDPLSPTSRRRPARREPILAALHAGSPDTALLSLMAIPGHEIDVAAFRRSFNLTMAEADRLFGAHALVRLGKAGGIGLGAPCVAMLETAACTVLAAHHDAHPEAGGLTRRGMREALAPANAGALLSEDALDAVLRRLIERRAIVQAGALLRLPEHSPSFSAAETALWRQLESWLETRGARPFTLQEAVTELHSTEAATRAMLYRRRVNGDIWQLAGARYLQREQLAVLADCAAGLARRCAAAGEDGFSAAQFRDASGIGRNMVIVVLEFFDAIGVTARRDDRRMLRPDYRAAIGVPEPERGPAGPLPIGPAAAARSAGAPPSAL